MGDDIQSSGFRFLKLGSAGLDEWQRDVMLRVMLLVMLLVTLLDSGI